MNHAANVETICAEHKMTRQAYYQYRHRRAQRLTHDATVLTHVREVRRTQPMLGTRKLKVLLKQNFQFAIGRDRLFSLLGEQQLLIRPKKKYVHTTNSHHRFRVYTNLIKEMPITRPNQVFVSDITYLATREGFSYLALLTDLYSRKIVGYDVSTSLAHEGCVRALEMAFASVEHPHAVIHHSDRGVQYCGTAYTTLLHNFGAQISMAEAGNVYENAVAERVNGILKTEFLLDQTFPSHRATHEAVRQAITIYNNERPHLSLNYATPAQMYGT